MEKILNTLPLEYSAMAVHFLDHAAKKK